MPTQKQIAASVLYANLMEEVKIRISAIDAGTSGLVRLQAPFIREFCFLQIRMICELIALGCLAAHGDITTSTKLRKEWAADKIMEELEKLHPEFFPRAMRQGRDADNHHTMEPVDGTLTKPQLLKLYHECGEVLHRGSIKKLLKANIPIQVNFPEITARAQKLNDLLEVHIVSMLGGDMHFICVLRNASDGMKVQVAIAESTELTPPST
jgi:hypothetical protein